MNQKLKQLEVQYWMADGGYSAHTPSLAPVDHQYHELLLEVNTSHKEVDHPRGELAAAQAVAIDEKMDADRRRRLISWLLGNRWRFDVGWAPEVGMRLGLA